MNARYGDNSGILVKDASDADNRKVETLLEAAAEVNTF